MVFKTCTSLGPWSQQFYMLKIQDLYKLESNWDHGPRSAYDAFVVTSAVVFRSGHKKENESKLERLKWTLRPWSRLVLFTIYSERVGSALCQELNSCYLMELT